MSFSACWGGSFDGDRGEHDGQGNFLQWFSATAFGGTNYSSTPVAAVSYVDDPSSSGVNDAARYFGLWHAGKAHGACAWYSRRTDAFQAVGDPFVKR